MKFELGDASMNTPKSWKYADIALTVDGWNPVICKKRTSLFTRTLSPRLSSCRRLRASYDIRAELVCFCSFNDIEQTAGIRMPCHSVRVVTTETCGINCRPSARFHPQETSVFANRLASFLSLSRIIIARVASKLYTTSSLEHVDFSCIGQCSNDHRSDSNRPDHHR